MPGNRGGLSLPAGVDHLIYAAADIRQGMDQLEHLLGVRPEVGGRHTRYGTRNALLSLGPATYLEVIAPDPGLRRPSRGVLFDNSYGETPRLVTWVLRAESLEEMVAAAAGVGLGEIHTGHRETPEGTSLSWRLTDPYAMPYDGAVPFLISWGVTPHPAATAPSGGTLIGLRIEHPQPAAVDQAIAALGVGMAVSSATSFRLVAAIETPRGIVEI